MPLRTCSRTLNRLIRFGSSPLASDRIVCRPHLCTPLGADSLTVLLAELDLRAGPRRYPGLRLSPPVYPSPGLAPTLVEAPRRSPPAPRTRPEVRRTEQNLDYRRRPRNSVRRVPYVGGPSCCRRQSYS